MPAGRPTIFRQDLIDVVFKLALLGATDVQMAEIMGVTKTCLENWKLKYPELVDSMKKGKAQADATVANSLYHRANGYTHESVKIFADAKTGAVVQVPYTEHYPPDTGAAIFWLKNRNPAQWRDRVEFEGGGIGGQTLVQINVIGGNGLPAPNLLDGKIEVGKGMARQLKPAGDERKVVQAKKRSDKSKMKGAK